MNNTNIFIKKILDSPILTESVQYGGKQNNTKSYLTTTNEYKGTNIISDDSIDSSISSDSSDMNNQSSLSESYPLFNYYGNIKKQKIKQKKKQKKGRINKSYNQNGGSRKIKFNMINNQIILKRVMI